MASINGVEVLPEVSSLFLTWLFFVSYPLIHIHSIDNNEILSANLSHKKLGLLATRVI